MQGSWRIGSLARALEQHLKERAVAVGHADTTSEATEAPANAPLPVPQVQWPPPVRVRRYYPLPQPAVPLDSLPAPALSNSQAELRARQPRAVVDAAMETLQYYEGGDDGVERDTVAVPVPPQTPLPDNDIAPSASIRRLFRTAVGSGGGSVVTASPARMSSAKSASQGQREQQHPTLQTLVTQRRRGQKRTAAEEVPAFPDHPDEHHHVDLIAAQPNPLADSSEPVWMTINDDYAKVFRRKEAEAEAAITMKKAGAPFPPKESPRLARVMNLIRSPAFSRSGALVFDGYHSLVRTSLFGADPFADPDDEMSVVVEHGALLRVAQLPEVMVHIETHEHAIAGAVAEQTDIKLKPERRNIGGGGKRRRSSSQQQQRTRTPGGSTNLALVGLFVEYAMHPLGSSSLPRLLPASSRMLGLPEGEMIVASVPQLRALLNSVLKAAAGTVEDLELCPTLLEA